jgi:hypothetical protein
MIYSNVAEDVAEGGKCEAFSDRAYRELSG